MRERFQVVVVGGGASGTLLAAHYRRVAPAGRLALVESTGPPSGGLAFSTPVDGHLLNVPAGKMSGLADEPGHFLDWLRARRPDVGAGAFVPRRCYGAYLASILEECGRNTTVVHDQVTDLARRDRGWDVRLESGATLASESVVLACGNRRPAPPSGWGAGRRRPPLHDPWDVDLASGLAPESAVLLLGTGLTMVDAVVSLRAAGHRGQLIALSRRGRLPRPHRESPAPPRALAPAGWEVASPLRTLRWMRREIDRAALDGGDWRSVVDGLRPHTAGIWRHWTPAGRASFLRHARSLWDVHRHRAAPAVQARLEGWLASGDLVVERGRLVTARVVGGEIEAAWRRPGRAGIRKVRVARAVNCTGPDPDLERAGPPLFRALRRAGWIRQDPLRLGLETDPAGAVLDAGGRSVPGLFAIGPLCRPAHWESTSIPEIRNQAADLAVRLTCTG